MDDGNQEVKESGDKMVKIGRLFDVLLSIFVVMVSIVMLVGPWYIVKEKHEQFHRDCAIEKGTAIVPMYSELCDGTVFKDIDNDWEHMITMIQILFAFSFFIAFALIVDYFRYKNARAGFRHINKLSFLLTCIPVILQIVILADVGDLKVPDKHEKTIAHSLLVVAFIITLLRMVYYLIIMYRHWVNNGGGDKTLSSLWANTGGQFGVGSSSRTRGF